MSAKISQRRVHPLLRIAFKSSSHCDLPTCEAGEHVPSKNFGSPFIRCDAGACPAQWLPIYSDDVVDVLLAAQAGKGHRGRRLQAARLARKLLIPPPCRSCTNPAC